MMADIKKVHVAAIQYLHEVMDFNVDQLAEVANQLKESTLVKSRTWLSRF